MRRFRIGNNLSIIWTLFNSDGTAHDLEEKELALYMTCGGYKYPVTDYTVTGNVISWTFMGIHQTKIGAYKINLVEHDDTIENHAIHINEAFMLIPEDYIVGNTAVTEGDATLRIRSIVTGVSGSAGGATIERIDTVVDGDVTTVTIVLTDGREFPFSVQSGTGPVGPAGPTGPAGAKGDTGAAGNNVLISTDWPDWDRPCWWFDPENLSGTPKIGDIILFFEEGGYIWAWRVSEFSGGGSAGARESDLILDEVDFGIRAVDNLNSTDTKNALSANQGRVLKEMIEALSPGGGEEGDVSGIEQKYSSVASPGTPTSNVNNWHDTRLSADVWTAIRFKKDGEWGAWSVIRIDARVVNSSYQAFVFRRINASSVSAPTGGTYDNPTDGLTAGWSDGVPSGNGMVWMSTRIFSSDGAAPQQANWSTPRLLVDSDTMDFEFSSVANPGVPNKATPSSTNTNPNWSNEANENTIWMAMCAVSNGVYAAGSSWMVVKIKGENGRDGTSVNILGKKTSSSELPSTGNTTGDAYLINGDLWVWDGDSWENAGKIKGEPGEDGQTPYIHIKYSNNGTEFTEDDGETPGDWIGIYWDYNPNDSRTFSDYTWKEWRGEDGFGYEYVFMLTQNASQRPELPVEDWDSVAYQADEHIPTSAGEFAWTDDPAGVSILYPYCWVIWRKKINGEWTRWLGSDGYARLFSHYGLNGPSGAIQFKSIVFKRGSSKPSLPGTGTNRTGSSPADSNGVTNSNYGGEFPTPIPYGWEDGIPAITDESTGGDTLWMTTRIFSSDGNHQDTWTPVQQAADTADIDFEYSAVETNPGTPTANPSNWHNVATQNDIWMAIRKFKNGEWGSWDILRIKGENGADGAGIVGTPVITYGMSASGDTLPATWEDNIEDVIVPNGYWLWVKTVTTYTTGTVTSYTKQRQTKDGASTACPFRGAYDSSETYYGDSARTDIVFDPTTNAYYRANPNAPQSPFSEATTDGASVLSNPDYWLPFGANYDNIATGFAFIENLTVMNLDTAGEDDTPQARIHASGNTMYMTDDDGEQRFRLTGDEIDITSASASYPINTTGVTDSMSKPINTTASKQGARSLAAYRTMLVSQGDTMLVPPISVKITLSFSSQMGNTGIGAATVYVTRNLMRGNTLVSQIDRSSIIVNTSSDSSNTVYYTNEAKELNGFLNDGAYDIAYLIEWNLYAEGYPTGTLVFTAIPEDKGSVVITGSTKRLVEIGANGLVIHLGAQFSVVLATDPDNNDMPVITLQGMDSNNNVIGLRITKHQGVQVSQDGTWKQVATTS